MEDGIQYMQDKSYLQAEASKEYFRPTGDIVLLLLFSVFTLLGSASQLFSKNERGYIVIIILSLISIAGSVIAINNAAKPVIIIRNNCISFYPPYSNDMKTIESGSLVTLYSRSRDILSFTTTDGNIEKISIGRLGKNDREEVLNLVLSLLNHHGNLPY
ncbi:MAG TPA: hypothetical protein PK747_09120 [Acidobacteriota bacterium]|mgnify:CR=1 FL=1|jgi:hypothetical protein|nr:hypothetical protein [Acidobacteriota bacterium]HNT18554.1 hypothetical protein [Acidobacteriota bacterium]HQO20279.1 hypothetical protein [Acidobacteriota bacterium]HQQ47553.1 hypothetical protein [Acidobacteriota bacterium]